MNRATAILVGVWALTIATALPAAAVLAGDVARDLGHSLSADSAADAVDYDWMQEFAARARGLDATLQPTIIGFGAVIDGPSAIAGRTSQPASIVAMAAAVITLWIFLAGGIIDRYARDRATRAHGFFGACGVFFFRFLRLAIAQAVVYGALFGLMHPSLFGRPTTVLARSVVYGIFGAVVAFANLVFDYAKVRAVVEDRRSMLGAVVNAVGFVRRNAAAAITLYALDAAVFAALVVAYGAGAPGSGRSVLVWAVVGIGQLVVAARLWVKLLFWASETALFQTRLAHAGYIARPEPVWPDSPAAEAISGS